MQISEALTQVKNQYGLVALVRKDKVDPHRDCKLGVYQYGDVNVTVECREHHEVLWDADLPSDDGADEYGMDYMEDRFGAEEP